MGGPVLSLQAFLSPQQLSLSLSPPPTPLRGFLTHTGTLRKHTFGTRRKELTF